MIRRIKGYPAVMLFKRSPARDVIEKDINRWVDMSAPSRSACSVLENMQWLLELENTEEFRNLLYYRIGSPSGVLDRLLLALARTIYRPLSTLRILTSSIGPGLVIRHGYGTVIQAEKIGANCLIFQEVVIGRRHETGGLPTIGNQVNISVGAKVLGPVSIGDFSVVGANCVVVKDVPAGCLALGIPARISVLDPDLATANRRE